MFLHLQLGRLGRLGYAYRSMRPSSQDRREANPLPAMAAVLVAVLALSVAGATDSHGGRHGRTVQMGSLLLLRVDGGSGGTVFDVEQDRERTPGIQSRRSGTPDLTAGHDRVLGPVVASGPARGDLPPPHLA